MGTAPDGCWIHGLERTGARGRRSVSQDTTTHAAFHSPPTAAGTLTPAPTLMRLLWPMQHAVVVGSSSCTPGQKLLFYDGAAPYCPPTFSRQRDARCSIDIITPDVQTYCDVVLLDAPRSRRLLLHAAP